MKIGNINIGDSHIFVIAEIGNNHNGSIERAIQMIDSAADTGADCVKFQMRNMTFAYRKKSLEKKGEDLGAEYVLDLLEKFELSIDEHKKISQYCKSKDILYMCTPWDLKSVEVLESFEVPAYKVASADLTNLPLINSLIKTGKPIILSTGMSSEEEIKISANFLNKKKAQYALLHCNSTYPAPFQDINLNWIKRLKAINPLVGYSGHERGIAVSLAAVGLGAKIIERHFTFDRNMEGPDHAASLEPLEFNDLVSGIRELEKALGEGSERLLSQGEMINRENLAKSLVSTCNLKQGTVIKPKHVKALSPGQGLSAQFFEKIVGLKLKRDMKKEDYFFPSDLNEKRIEPREYSFKRPWGVPVRYHDFSEYESKIKPDIFEFHLSYSDLELNIEDYFSKTYEYGLVVHAPELFAGSQLMDLASSDDEYRKYSIKETQKVINLTRSLKKYFPSTEKPMIVANIGGFSMDEPLQESDLEVCFSKFSDSLSKLDMKEIELIPQTMAPFPWHFGGQRYQNLFLQSDQILRWCKEFNLRICFDISHSRLMCNHFGLDFYEFAKEVAPLTAHLHLGDAKGINGEGLQIGHGDINFIQLCTILNGLCPDASFIPEIWQGHKNGGEGFWLALEDLEKKFRM